MPKYRLLTADELGDLKKEFIDYLIVNGIDASGWEKIKKDDNAKAERVLDLFSDVVFEEVLRRTRYLFRITDGVAFAFRFLEDKAQLYIMEFLEAVQLEAKEEALIAHLQKSRASMRIHFQEKGYDKAREKSIFDLMEAGAWVSEGKIFEYLLKTQSN